MIPLEQTAPTRPSDAAPPPTVPTLPADPLSQLAWEVAAMNRLQELSARLIYAKDLPAVLTETMEAAMSLLRSDFASTQLYDPATNTLSLVAHRNFKPEVVSYYQTVELGHGSVCGLALSQGARIILEDLLADTRCQSDFEITRIAGFRGMQSTPLRARDGRLIGMVSTHWRKAHRPSERELRILDLYVRQATDMVERMQAEERLRDSEQRFAAIFNQAAAGIACADLDGRFTTVNDHYCRIAGRPREQLIGVRVQDITHPDDWPENLGRLQAIRDGQPSRTFDKRYIRPDGSIVWVSLDISVIRDARGETVATMAVCQNVTERKQTEQKLRQSEERYRSLFDSIDEGFCVIEMLFNEAGEPCDYRFLEANPAFEKHTGLTGAVGRTIRDLAPSHEQHWFETYGRVAVTGEPIRFEQAAQALGRWFDVYAFRSGAEDNRRVALLFTDITARKRVEESVRLRTAQFEALFNDAPLAVYLVDSQFRIREVNPLARPVFGGVPNLIGRDFDEVLHILWPKAYADEVVARFRHTLDTGEPFVVPERAEERIDRHIVEYYEWAIHRIPLPEGGFGVACYFRDISPVVRAREALRDSQRLLQQMNAQLEQRVAERTHELLDRQRQLRRLTVELTRAEQAERRRLANVLHDHLQQLLVAAKMRAEQARLRVVDQGVNAPLDACSKLISQSIETSRSLTAQLSPPVLYDGGLVPALAWLARWMQDKHEMTVNLEADAGAEPQAEDVRLMLFEATRELLFNVAKHAGVDDAAVAMAPDGEDRVKITITDRGLGFDPAALEADEHKRGIGLLHTRERLRYIGGDMTIASAPGGGTCVTLIAPRAMLPEHEPHDADPRGAGPRSAGAPLGAAEQAKRRPATKGAQAIRVLVVDDHQIMRQGLVSILLDEPQIEVVGEACDGDAAIELTQTLQPDVVIMDVTMPGLSGVEATRRIKRSYPAIRVIALSMHDETDMAQSMRSAGAAAYLTKGGPSESLVNAIKN